MSVALLLLLFSRLNCCSSCKHPIMYFVPSAVGRPAGQFRGELDSLGLRRLAPHTHPSPAGRAGLAAIISHVGPIIVDRPGKCSPAECTP